MMCSFFLIERFYVEFRGQPDLWLLGLCRGFATCLLRLIVCVCDFFGEMAHDNDDNEEWCWEVTASNVAKSKWSHNEVSLCSDSSSYNLVTLGVCSIPILKHTSFHCRVFVNRENHNQNQQMCLFWTPDPAWMILWCFRPYPTKVRDVDRLIYSCFLCFLLNCRVFNTAGVPFGTFRTMSRPGLNFFRNPFFGGWNVLNFDHRIPNSTRMFCCWMVRRSLLGVQG